MPEVDIALDNAYDAVMAYDDDNPYEAVIAGGIRLDAVRLPPPSVYITRLLPLIYTSCQYVPSAERCVL